MSKLNIPFICSRRHVGAGSQGRDPEQGSCWGDRHSPVQRGKERTERRREHKDVVLQAEEGEVKNQEQVARKGEEDKAKGLPGGGVFNVLF